jgi:FixJ family two-component response regulator
MLVSIVDDDESVRDSTGTLLRSAGYKIAKFDSGEQFLESDKISQTSCLILDIRMPGMDGLELQRRLNVAAAGVPVIFSTAYESQHDRRRAFEAGASHFFEKPFVAADFLTAVETAVSGVTRS